jgi:hypothetical protein
VRRNNCLRAWAGGRIVWACSRIKCWRGVRQGRADRWWRQGRRSLSRGLRRDTSRAPRSTASTCTGTTATTTYEYVGGLVGMWVCGTLLLSCLLFYLFIELIYFAGLCLPGVLLGYSLGLHALSCPVQALVPLRIHVLLQLRRG